MESLTHFVGEELAQPVPPGALVLADAIRAEHPGSVKAILFYGSCLRKQTDVDGLLDLYVLPERYDRFYPGRGWAMANAILAPNVFYLEAEDGGVRYRTKYSVVSLGQFERYTSPNCFHPYYWARFAQPCALVFSASDEVKERMARALASAIRTFVARSLPLVERQFRIEDLWREGLGQSYRAEVRPERRQATSGLYEAAAQRYETMTRAALVELGASAAAVEGDLVEVPQSLPREPYARALWRLRRWLGKTLSPATDLESGPDVSRRDRLCAVEDPTPRRHSDRYELERAAVPAARADSNVLGADPPPSDSLS